MLSFGTVIPDIQLRAEKLTQNIHFFGFNLEAYSNVLIGITIATFSFAQFVVAPILGKISDRVGRRPVLIITCIVAVLSCIVYAFANTLPIMILSRALLGIAGANLGVAYAYIGDVTSTENRAATMGKLGMAFGIGFIFGPPLGAFLIKLGQGSPIFLGIGSAILAFINFLFVFFFLPESLTNEVREERNNKPKEKKLSRVQQLKKAFAYPGLRNLFILFFVASFAFSNLETTFYRVGEDVYLLQVEETTLVLVFVGIIAAVVQGGLIKGLVRRFGEVNLVRAGYLFQSPILFAIPFVRPWFTLLAGTLFLGISSGIASPPLTSLISQSAPKEISGEIFGVNQSLGSLARIIGPVVANSLYGFGPVTPYAFAAIVMLVPTLMAWKIAPPQNSNNSPEAVS